MTIMATLEAARDVMAAIPGVATCKVGEEANISPADFPLIRIVLERIIPGKPYGNTTCEVMIKFGMDKSEAEDGLEAMYASILGLHQSILDALKTVQGKWLSTETDRDQIQPYKVLAIRYELQGS